MAHRSDIHETMNIPNHTNLPQGISALLRRHISYSQLPFPTQSFPLSQPARPPLFTQRQTKNVCVDWYEDTDTVIRFKSLWLS